MTLLADPTQIRLGCLLGLCDQIEDAMLRTDAPAAARLVRLAMDSLGGSYPALVVQLRVRRLWLTYFLKWPPHLPHERPGDKERLSDEQMDDLVERIKRT